MSISIKPQNLQWLEGTPAEKDLCAHGGVVIQCSEVEYVDQRDENWTLSAAAIYLLRTLTMDHTRENPVGDHLFPCCGHGMFTQDQSSDVVIIGCPSGFDFIVLHQGNEVELRFDNGRELVVPGAEWRRAVLDFSDSVQAFYLASEEKVPGESSEGYAAFLAEWGRRADEARSEIENERT